MGCHESHKSLWVFLNNIKAFNNTFFHFALLDHETLGMGVEYYDLK